MGSNWSSIRCIRRRIPSAKSGQRTARAVPMAGPDERRAPVSICRKLPLWQMEQLMDKPDLSRSVAYLVLDVDNSQQHSQTVAKNCPHVRVLNLYAAQSGLPLRAQELLSELAETNSKFQETSWMHVRLLLTEGEPLSLDNTIHDALPNLDSVAMASGSSATLKRRHHGIALARVMLNGRIAEDQLSERGPFPSDIRALDITVEINDWRDDYFPRLSEQLERLDKQLRYLRISAPRADFGVMAHVLGACSRLDTLCIGLSANSSYNADLPLLAGMTKRPKALVLEVQCSTNGHSRVGRLITVIGKNRKAFQALRTLEVSIVGPPLNNIGQPTEDIDRLGMRTAILALLRRNCAPFRISVRVHFVD